MQKPYIICHMMSSLDGRIDCGMTIQLPGNSEYYEALESLDLDAKVSGRVTAELEMATGGHFQTDDTTPYGHSGYHKQQDAGYYDVIMDTKGTLLWSDDRHANVPKIIVMSEQVPKAYLDYLDQRHLSWIVAGQERIDLAQAMAILTTQFGVKRLGVVGGGTINGGFLEAGLLDEISVMVAPGIDGRAGFVGVFDGRARDAKPLTIQFKEAKTFANGLVWLRYTL